jgi:hypothetical protein
MKSLVRTNYTLQKACLGLRQGACLIPFLLHPIGKTRLFLLSLENERNKPRPPKQAL